MAYPPIPQSSLSELEKGSDSAPSGSLAGPGYSEESSVTASDTHGLLTDSPNATRQHTPTAKGPRGARDRIIDALKLVGLFICSAMLTYTASFLYIALGGHILKYPSLISSKPRRSPTHAYTPAEIAALTDPNRAEGPSTVGYFAAAGVGTGVLSLLICIAAAVETWRRRRAGRQGTGRLWFLVLTGGSTIAGFFALAVGDLLVPDSLEADGYGFVNALKAGGVGGAILAIPTFIFFALVVFSRGLVFSAFLWWTVW
ncbi:hypothetical protein C8Q76DRAFT_800347 [Earliella scabrosa]|nr:hypothetical protein C8Q76DRAFT_800347 [Earliella scabrosa]